MSKTLKANGDVWQAVPGGPSRRAGYRTVVFLCESNGQRPYRVVELAHDGADIMRLVLGQFDLDALLQGRLDEQARQAFGRPGRSSGHGIRLACDGTRVTIRL